MLRRLILTGLIVQQFVWLNIVIPGHTRGRFTLPGSSSRACCGAARGRSSPNNPADPPSGDRARCAICFYATSTCTPPVIDCSPGKLGLLETLDSPAVPISRSADFRVTYYGRAPPAASLIA